MLDPNPESDQHQNLLTSRGSPLAHPYQIWSCIHMHIDIHHCIHELSCGQTHIHTADHNTCFASIQKHTGKNSICWKNNKDCTRILTI